MSKSTSPNAQEIYERNPEKVEELAERDDAMGIACRAVIDLAEGDRDD